MTPRPLSSTRRPFAVFIGQVFSFRWQPGIDLAAVAASWILVVAGLYAATFLVGTTPLGGMGYFLTYAVLTALAFGVCLPVGWMLFVRKGSPRSLGITSKNLALSIAVQVVVAAVQLFLMRRSFQLPGARTLLPLVCLSLAIGLFEAVFWRGWVCGKNLQEANQLRVTSLPAQRPPKKGKGL